MNPAPNNNSRKNIFISYRVQDTAGETGRLVDSLKQYFEEDQIFMDIDKLEPGVNFKDVISKSLESCDVMLAVIGPNWAGAKNATGVSRIKQANDWVRLELSTALSRNIRVVPILVDGAQLPEEDELPEDMQSLLGRQSYEISNKRWKYDTDQLIAFLHNSVGIKVKVSRLAPPPPQAKSGGTPAWLKGIIGGLAALGVLAIVGVMINNNDKSNAVKTDPQPSVNNPQNPVRQPVENPPVNPEPEPVKKEVPEMIDIQGNWYDASVFVTLAVSQEENRLEFLSYYGGQNTGAGTGAVKANKITFTIHAYNTTIVVTGNGVISDDHSVISGMATTSGNGASFTLPFTWTRLQ